MGYLGNTPGESFISFAKQVFTIVNSQTAYTLNFAVVDENELRLVINNVVQEPGSGKAYTASGTTLTLSSALTNGTDEMYCVFLGKARETVTVPTITRDKLNLISDGSNPSLIAKGTSGVSEGYIQLNCAENSHGIKLKSPPHSAAQSYTLTFPQSITNNTFLKTDGSGNLSFAEAGAITAEFLAYRGTSTQTGIADNVATKLQFNTESFDPDGVFDNSTNYRFTAPSAGKYVLYTNIYIYDASTDIQTFNLAFYKNGSLFTQTYWLKNSGGRLKYAPLSLTLVANLSASDYIEVYATVDTVDGGTTNLEHEGSGAIVNSFGGYKLIT